MTSQSVLLTNVKQVLIDLRSDKATLRAHGLQNFHNILDTRSAELRVILRPNANNRHPDDYDEDFTWTQLFDGLHDAIREQCQRIYAAKSTQSQKTLISKNDEYKEALRKCINVANEKIAHVSYKKICVSAFECFGTANIAMYYDALYLQIVYKHILNAKHSTGELLVADWSRLLSIVFELLDKRNCQIQKLELLQCIPLILQHAAKYTYLVSDLDQYLSNIVRIVNDGQLQNQINAQKQIFFIVHEFVRNLAINRRSTIVSFTEQILDKLLKFYQFSMDADCKVILFKIMHIAIVVHYPEPVSVDEPHSNGEILDDTNDDLFKKSMADDVQLWHKHLRNMLSLVEREIVDARKRNLRLNPVPVVCPIFVRMAAKLCSVVFWKDDVWNKASTSDEQQQKRRRHSMMLEKLMDFVEYELGKFCWRWFAILSQLIVDFPYVLKGNKDYQSLLHLLTEYKPTIQHPLHMKYFIRITEVMVRKESERNQSASVEHWHKIMELSFKQAETDKTQLENVDLMRVLVDNKVIVSHDFIKNIIIAIAKTQTIRKSNSSIRLLISVLKNVDMIDMIDDINSLKIAIIHWLSAKIKLSELRKVIENNNNTDAHLISELYVLCTLSRQGSTSYKKIDRCDTVVNQDDFEVRDHDLFIDELVQCLQYRMLSKLVVVNNTMHSKLQNSVGIKKLPESNAVKVCLNETIFGELEKAIRDADSDNVDNSLESFNIIISLLAANVNILNSLVDYESIDGDTFLKFLTKRVLVRIGQLNEIIKNVGNSYRIDNNPNDVNEIVNSLLDVWHDKYHPIVNANIFVVKNSIHLIKWLEAQLVPFNRPSSILMTPLKNASQLEFEERIQLKCLTLLAHFSAYQEPEDDDLDVFNAISSYEFNYKRNEDLFIDLQLVKIILSQRCPSQDQTDWAFGELQEICSEHQTHHEYIELVVEYIPDLVRCVKPYSNSDMHDHLIQLISKVLKRCKTKKLSHFACLKIIKGVEYFAQEFFNIEDGQTIIKYLMHFLRSEYYTVQIATISCLTSIFDKRWLSYNNDEVDCLKIQDFHVDLAKSLEINGLSNIDENDTDRKACIASICIQLHCSIIGMCYALRKEMWFQMIEFCSQTLKLNEAKIYEIVEKLCVEVFHNTTPNLLADLIPHLIGLWIDKNYLLINFPTKLSGSHSKNDFMLDHSDIITLRIIQYKSELIPELLRIFETTSLARILTTTILVKCLAWLTSVNCTPNASKYVQQATKMLTILRKEKPNIEDYFKSHSLEIIEELFKNVWNAEKFTELFEIDVEFISDDSTIDFTTFTKSLEYVQRKSSKPSNVVHYFCAMAPRKVINTLYVLKLQFQQSTCEEHSLSELFRVCTLIEIIVGFIIEYAAEATHSNTIGFFIRDFVYFFGNVISSGECGDKLKLATCKYFYKFCEKILPACAKHFQSHLNYIVSILLQITRTEVQSKIFETGMALLQFLISEQTSALEVAIGELDSFPMQKEFDELRRIQHEVKYKGKSFSLLEEIEYFLKVEKRKVEGLLSLKEHLSKKKSELQEIYKTIYDTRGFSEDCEKSPIHRLISTLLTHIVQNVDSEKALLAAKCLGELGPSDLGSIALKFDNQTQTYKICNSFDEAITNVCEHALEKLNGILVHSDATVLQAAADACKHMLEFQMAVSLLNNYPLLRVFETGTGTLWPLKQTDQQIDDLSKLFNDDAFSKPYSFWVKSMAIELFKLFDGESLAKVASKQTQFAVSMIPLLVKALLMTRNDAYHHAMYTAVNLFFAKNFAKISSESMEVDNQTPSELTSYVYLDKVSIKLMLNVAECIRVHNKNVQSADRLNYLHIAKAALYCEAYFTAILYGELASFEGKVDNNTIEIRSIMKSAYQSIGEIDAVSAFLDPINDKLEYLELNRCWDQILIGCDAQSNNSLQYADYLGKAGLYNLANKLTNGGNSAANYECAWRLADWNIIEGGGAESAVNPQNNDLALEFNKSHYFALKNLNKKDQIGVKINVENAFNAVIKMFKQSSYECTKNIYKNLMMLHLLQQIDEFCCIQFPNRDDKMDPEFIINKWNYQDQMSLCGFSYHEPILAQRVIMVQSAGVRAMRKIANVCKFGASLQQMILNLITECREEGYFNLGERYSATLHKMQLSHEMKAESLIEDAQLSWTRGEGEMAKHMIAAVINENKPTFTHAKALWMMGKYLADSRLEDTNTIIKKYFEKSVQFSAKVKQIDNIPVESPYYRTPEDRKRLDLVNRKRNYQAIAKYADREYQQIAAYKKSSEFEKKLENIKRHKEQLSDMQRRQKNNSLTKDENKTLTLVIKNISIDESDVKSTNTEYDQYLQLAIEFYIQTLLLESENELCSSAMFRLFGLWFSNLNCKEILKEIEEHYQKIPSHKFIALMPQITAHLSTDGIKDIIQEIVLKCTKHHPHHVLPKIFEIFNAFKDEDYTKDARQKSKAITSSPRTDAAGQLLQKLKGVTGLRDIIVQMEKMSEVLIRLANTSIPNAKEFSSKEPIRHLRDLDLVHCPTVDLPIRMSGDYTQSIVGISKWKSKFLLTAGINAPKRIECVGLNGRTYLQLLKGTDDLRQDQVMQQVFGIMNNLLSQSKMTKKDRLHIRTYIVVPLSQRSGILEWCDNTMPLTDYLVGSTQKKSAHERFHPQDWTPAECRRKLAAVSLREPNASFENTYKTFKSICDHIKPVFHHFFFEHFYNPGVWFERRMAYAHSLATTSMIGYILGIGDRHVSNILIDKTTAELIHIDFGIAFEQGKCLPTPEQIPFRLTRDLVSALGPSGVEGVYRKSCEKTMEVLRQNKSTILTIVEVLLHDPLYAWTLTSSAASKRQQTSVHIDEDQDINTMAERALWRLEEKLDGKHVSRSESISVKRHVEILINEATNQKLLCRLFVGWQPYL